MENMTLKENDGVKEGVDQETVDAVREVGGKYKYGWSTDIEMEYAPKGLTPEEVEQSFGFKRIIEKLVAESKKLAPAKVVIVCFPALMISASSSPSKGKGPMPSTPFSL